MRPRYAENIGVELWPHLAGRRGAAHGGPSAAQATANRQLGKLRALGLVRQVHRAPEGASYADDLWMITEAGKRVLDALG